MRETFNQIVLNKTLRTMAVKKMDKMLHNSLINGYGVPALPAEKKQHPRQKDPHPEEQDAGFFQVPPVLFWRGCAHGDISATPVLPGAS